MKITRLEVIKAHSWRWVRIHTDEDLTGIGELHGGSGGSGTAYTVTAAVSYMAEYLVGKNPFQIERHWQHMFRRCLLRGGADAMAALGATDVALWDIAGRHINETIRSEKTSQQQYANARLNWEPFPALACSSDV